MKQTSYIRALILGGMLAVGLTTPGFGETLPVEPSEEYLINEDVNIITGLYVREYSLNGTGRVDYKTARQIVLSEYNDYWNSVVETKEFPLFYWYDVDQDGTVEMFVDQKVNGCPCDIQPYEALQEAVQESISLTREKQ